jgi:hypothetical protein
MTLKRFLQYLRIGPGFCSGNFSRNCESLNLHSMRTVKAAGVQWGWIGFMFYRAVPIVPEKTREEQIVREKLSYLKRQGRDQIWGGIAAVLVFTSVMTGLYYYTQNAFSHASYCELVAIFLLLFSQTNWNQKHTIQVLIPGARAGDTLQVVHTAASDGYTAEDHRCFKCGCSAELVSLLCGNRTCSNYGKPYFGKRAGHCGICASPLEDDGFCTNLNCKNSNPLDVAVACCDECNSALDENGLCTYSSCPYSTHQQDDLFMEDGQ